MSWYKTAKNDKEFDYENLTKEFWRELLFKEKDRLKISFDLENNDNCGDIRDVELDKVFKTKVGNEYKHKISAQMMSAGGDWENPVRYFRCQVAKKSKNFDEWSKYYKGEYTFIYIPEPKDGNKHLRKSDSKDWNFSATQEEADYFKYESKDEKKLWDALKKHCPKRIEEYYEDRYFSDDTTPKEVGKKHGVYGKYDLHRVF